MAVTEWQWVAWPCCSSPIPAQPTAPSDPTQDTSFLDPFQYIRYQLCWDVLKEVAFVTHGQETK